MAVNKVILIGNVGKDPDTRSTNDGREIATLSLATSETWKDKSTGEKKEKTEWHRIVIFSPGIVGFVKGYVKKGSKVYIEGSLATRKWTDNQGVEKFSTEIILQNFGAVLQLLDFGNKSDSGYHSAYQDPAPARKSSGIVVEETDDEIPF